MIFCFVKNRICFLALAYGIRGRPMPFRRSRYRNAIKTVCVSQVSGFYGNSRSRTCWCHTRRRVLPLCTGFNLCDPCPALCLILRDSNPSSDTWRVSASFGPIVLRPSMTACRGSASRRASRRLFPWFLWRSGAKLYGLSPRYELFKSRPQHCCGRSL